MSCCVRPNLLNVKRMEVRNGLEMREGWITFPPTTGRRQRLETSVTFPRPVRNGTESNDRDVAQVVLKGYNNPL